MEGFEPGGALPPATLPASVEQQQLGSRGVLLAGAQPVAVVILIEVDAKGTLPAGGLIGALSGATA